MSADQKQGDAAFNPNNGGGGGTGGSGGGGGTGGSGGGGGGGDGGGTPGHHGNPPIDGLFNGILPPIDGLFNGILAPVDGIFNGLLPPIDGLFNGLLSDGEIANNILDSLLGGGHGKGLLSSLLNGHELASATVNGGGSAAGNGDHTGLTVDIGAANNGAGLLNIDANSGSTFAGDILSSLLSNGDGGGGFGSALNGQRLLDLNVGPANGDGDALITVNTDPGSTLRGNEGTLGSLFGNGDGGGGIGTLLNANGLVHVNIGSANGDGHSLLSVNANPGPVFGGGGNGLGNATDMGLIAALTGHDGQHTVGMPTVDVPHDISLHEMPVADLHVHHA
jgi:hypothetical protein